MIHRIIFITALSELENIVKAFHQQKQGFGNNLLLTGLILIFPFPCWKGSERRMRPLPTHWLILSMGINSISCKNCFKG